MTDFWNDSPRLEAALAGVESIITEILRDPAFPLWRETSRIVLSNGKMLRPGMVLIGAGFGSSRGRGATPGRDAARDERIAHIAAAIELLHAATLVHDDILDAADTRRGESTLHPRFGATNAVLAGDWLFARCFRLVADHADARSARVLARLVGTICAAEVRQDLAKFNYSTSVRGYLRTIAGKTAALFALALHVGAAEAKAPPLVVQRLRRVGYNLGMAFQIIDDVLDYGGDGLAIGKPAGNDVKEGLATLPLICALRADRDGIMPLLERARLDDAGVDLVVRAVVASGGVDQARAMAATFTARARRELARLPARPERDELALLVDRLLSRTR